MKPGYYEHVVWRGANRCNDLRFALETDGEIDEVALLGSVFVLTVSRLDGTLVFPAKTAEPVDGWVHFRITLAESRLIPLGRHTKAEVERRIADPGAAEDVQEPWLYGPWIGHGGDNIDTAVTV